MAKEGVQNLSTHKIAKEAGVSVGTIYLYFKDKETLLNQLVLYLFNTFHSAVDREYDPCLCLSNIKNCGMQFGSLCWITLILLKICISTSRYHNFKRQWWNV
ncbi:TetR/AcrR family transcriptional regulator [Glaesserella parasuis]|nr:TetR/AcrR family transcriptional regulator [Glaesserella parasuis]MDE4019437.1 TetR/AcrR family transcriptional regulator [Glaesserella parasuis]MDE4025318.1 TetR/AcrR family transcriptional regulator [Glaesserella parasuis]